MVSERQKYISVVLRGLGFAFLTPVGSITFQWLVFQKGAFWGNFFYSLIVLFLGVILLISGFVVLMEKK